MKAKRVKFKVKLRCDKMWGRTTCNWFVHCFPEMKGKRMVFQSGKAVEFTGRVGMLDWLMTNSYL